MDLSSDLTGFFDETIDTVNIEDLTKKVESSILTILKSTHRDSRKHRFHKRAKSIQFACPICGDSATDSSKQRGHIYLSYGLYKCYNNNNCARSIQEFFAEFGMDNLFTGAELHELKKIAVASRAELYIARQSISTTEVDEITPFLFEKKDIAAMFGAIELESDSYLRKKIEDRKIPMHKMPYLLWSPDDHSLMILNMHGPTGRVISFQRRMMRPGYTGPKYLTTTFSELQAIKCELRHKWRPPKDEIPMELIAERSHIPEETLKRYDITSQYFNVLNIDWGDDIFVFEGPIDSFFMPNSLALSGTGADLKHPTFHYIFDDDVPGKKEAMKRLDNREPVFMWKKFYMEHYEYRRPYAKKTDFNDLWKIKPFSPDLIKQYFTNNPLNKLHV